MKAYCLPAFVFAATVSSSAFAGFLIDGIDRDTWASSVPGVYSTNANEDQTGESYVRLDIYGGYGGQAYDAEAMYAAYKDGKLFIALVTGHDPLTSNDPARNIFAAGDFAFDFGKDGTYDLGINVVNGFNDDELGGVYKNPTWAYGLWKADGTQVNPGSPDADTARPTSLIDGKLIGKIDDDSSYTNDGMGVIGYGAYQNDTHFFYEISLDLEMLFREVNWDGGEFNIHWTQNCANDSILLEVGAYVPEPGSLALFGIGMIGLLGGGLRRRSLCQEHLQQAV